MSTTQQPKPVPANVALRLLEDSLAYYTPPAVLDLRDSPAPQTSWMPYYDAA